MTAARRVPFAAVMWMLVAGAALWSVGGLSTYDETWFLQVTSRLAGGEPLYRDVAYGATPLAVWVTLPLVWLGGAQVLWVKAVVVACFAASLFLLVAIGRRLGVSNLVLAAAGVALLVWAPPIRAAPYQPLATVLLLASLAATLVWLDDRSARRLALAGALAGLAFATKQNVGLYAGAALAGSVLLAAGGGRIRALAVAAAGYLGAVALALVPVAVTGGLGDLWNYGFAHKGSYVERGSISYLRGIDLQWHVIRYPIDDAADLGSAVVHTYELAAYFLVPVVLVALAVAFVRARGAERVRAGVFGLFTLAAAAAIPPRADISHVGFVFPAILAGGLYACWALLPPARLRTAAIVAIVLLAPVAAARALEPAGQLVAGTLEVSDLPHARGVLVEPEVETRIAATSAALAREPEPVFLAASEAGMLYLVSGIPDETPFDYPLATTLGRDGEDRLAADIERGRFAAVCVNFGTETDLVPTRLVAAIERSLVPGEDLGACRLYRRP